MAATLQVTSCPSCGAALALADRECRACNAPRPAAAGGSRPDDDPREPQRSQVLSSRSGGSAPPPPGLAPRPGRPPSAARSPWTASALTAPDGPLEPPPIATAPKILGLPEPWFFLLCGLVLAPILTFTPILRYMGWFLGSLFHETGHAIVGWYLGCPTVPAIRIDGHAAALHGDPSTILRLVWVAVLALLTVRMRKRPILRILLGLALLSYPVLAFTDAREIAFLLAGHLGEAGFATVLLLQALDGGFSGTREERATHSMVGWYLVGRNVSLCGGLVLQSASRAAYAESGSFDLVNDYLRVARIFGVGLEPVALVMLVVALLPVPLAILLERARAQVG